MGDRSQRARLCAGASIFVIASVFGAAGVANAQSVSPDELRVLKAQIDALQAKVQGPRVQAAAERRQRSGGQEAGERSASSSRCRQSQCVAASATAAKTQTQVANLPVKGTEKDEWFFRHKPGDPLTFETPGGEIPATAISTCRSTAPQRLSLVTPAVRPTSTAVTAAASDCHRQFRLDA